MTKQQKLDKLREVNGVYEDILKLKDVDAMFDLLIAGAYFRGQFNGKVPVSESRLVFERIKQLLVNKGE